MARAGPASAREAERVLIYVPSAQACDRADLLHWVLSHVGQPVEALSSKYKSAPTVVAAWARGEEADGALSLGAATAVHFVGAVTAVVVVVDASRSARRVEVATE